MALVISTYVLLHLMPTVVYILYSLSPADGVNYKMVDVREGTMDIDPRDEDLQRSLVSCSDLCLASKCEGFAVSPAVNNRIYCILNTNPQSLPQRNWTIFAGMLNDYKQFHKAVYILIRMLDWSN